MSRIKIMTDSACDIPKELEEQYDIRIPVSYTHLDVYKRQALYRSVLEADAQRRFGIIPVGEREAGG